MEQNALKFCFSFLLICFAAGCASGTFAHAAYVVKNCEIKNRNIEFSVKNTSQKQITAFSVFIECEPDSSESDFSERCTAEKEFSATIEPGGTDSFCIRIDDLADENITLQEYLQEYDETEPLENIFFIHRFFLNKITYSDGTTLTDRYGTYCF